MSKIYLFSGVLAVFLVVSCTGPKRGQAVVITAPARFEPQGNWMYLTLADSSNHFELPWSMPPAYSGPVNLEKDRIYSFTVVQERIASGITAPEVIKIEQDGRLIYAEDICEIHHAAMHSKKVRVEYGFPVLGPGEPSPETFKQLFPHCNEFVLGGCQIFPDSPRKTTIYVCDACKQAYAAWKMDHGKVGK